MYSAFEYYNSPEHQLQKEINKAQRKEIRNERKEERLHAKAHRAIARGNLGKAARLEAAADNAHMRAQYAHAQEAEARDALRRTRTTGYHVTPIGPVPPSPSVTVVQQRSQYPAYRGYGRGPQVYVQQGAPPVHQQTTIRTTYSSGYVTTGTVNGPALPHEHRPPYPNDPPPPYY